MIGILFVYVLSFHSFVKVLEVIYPVVQNRAKALKILRAKLFEKERLQIAMVRSNLRQEQVRVLMKCTIFGFKDLCSTRFLSCYCESYCECQNVTPIFNRNPILTCFDFWRRDLREFVLVLT